MQQTLAAKPTPTDVIRDFAVDAGMLRVRSHSAAPRQASPALAHPRRPLRVGQKLSQGAGEGADRPAGRGPLAPGSTLGQPPTVVADRPRVLVGMQHPLEDASR